MSEEYNDYLVDLPNPYDIEGSWLNVGNFESREEALAFVQATFGADEDGKISLITAS
jgi:hypothetical protein